MNLKSNLTEFLQYLLKIHFQMMKKQGSGIAAILDESPKGSKKGFGVKSVDVSNNGKNLNLTFLFNL